MNERIWVCAELLLVHWEKEAVRDGEKQESHCTFASFETLPPRGWILFWAADIIVGPWLGARLVAGMTEHFFCQNVEILQCPGEFLI